MNKEKSFAKELAELINRHSIDAKFETADDILATVAIDALNAYAKAKQTQERRNNRRLRLPGVSNAPSVGGKESRPPGTRQKGIQETGGVRRSKGGASNGGIFRRNVPRNNG